MTRTQFSEPNRRRMTMDMARWRLDRTFNARTSAHCLQVSPISLEAFAAMRFLSTITALGLTGMAFAGVLISARQGQCEPIGEHCDLHTTNDAQCCTGLTCKDYTGLAVSTSLDIEGHHTNNCLLDIRQMRT